MKDTTGIASELNTSGGANTYRFKSFKQRADEIEINVARRLVRDFGEPEDSQSYFAECIGKQGELNCTRDYTEFYNRVKNYHQSLAQVLYHKDEVVSVIEGYLSLDHELVLESMLDLVTALARDLQDEIMPYFERLVTKIAPLVKADIAEVVEAACNALAYLFKYLSKFLIGDLRPTFDLLTPLLGVEKQKANVRRFAAESLAFLIRKLRGDSLQQFVHHVLASLSECPSTRLDSYRDGLSLLFFECMRGVKDELHSRASGTMAALLRELYKDDLGDDLRLEDSAQYVLVASTLKLCFHHAKREPAMQLWTVLFNEFDMQAQGIERDGCSSKSVQPLVSLTGLLAVATLIRKGSRVSDYAPLLQRCRKAFEIAKAGELTGHVAETFAHERTKWLTSLLLQCNVAEMVSIGRVLLDMAVAQEPLDRVLAMALTLARLQWPQWQQIMLPYVVQQTTAKWPTDRTTLLLFWAELLQKNLFQPQGSSISSVITSSGHITFANRAAKAKDGSGVSSIAANLLSWLNEPVEWQELIENPMVLPSSDKVEFSGFDSSSSHCAVASELAIKSAILSMVSRVSVESTVLLESLGVFSSQLCKTIADLTQQLSDKSNFLMAGQQDANVAQGPESEQPWSDSATSALGLDTAADDRLYWGRYYQIVPLVSLLGRALEMLSARALQVEPKLATQTLLGSWQAATEKVIPAHASNVALVAGLVQVAESLRYFASAKKQAVVDVFTLAQLERMFPYFESNLASFQANLRLKTLQLLATFEQPRMLESKETKNASELRRGPAPVCEMVAIAVELESVKVGFDTYKERMNHLRRMAVFAANGCVPAIYENVFPYLAVAQMSVNFRTVWSDASAQLARLASANAELFWKAVWGVLSRYNDERRLIEPGLTPSAKKLLKARQEQWEEQGTVATQPKVDGHVLECPNVARFDSVYDSDLQLFDRSSHSTICGLQYLMIGAGGQDLERIDYTNVQRQLLKLIADCGATIAEKHSRPVVRSFLAFVRYDLDWTSALYRKGLMNDDVDLTGVRASEFCGLLTDKGRKQKQALLELWLGVFAKMRSPRSLYKWSTLYDLFTRMLSRGDNAVQRRALDCLLVWRESEITPYADNLRNLLDEKRFRDELGTFDLATTGESINVVHRAKLLPVVFRILHGQTLVRSGKASRKDGMKIRRAAVLSAMAAVSADELRLFVSIGLESFRAVLASATPEEMIHGSSAEPFCFGYRADDMDVDGEEEGNVDEAMVDAAGGLAIEKVSSKAQISFFHLLSEMVRQLGFKTTPVIHEALVILLSAIENAERQIDAANVEIQKMIAAGRESGCLVDQDEDEGDDQDGVEAGEDDEDGDEDGDGDGEKTLASGSAADSTRGQIEHRKSVARSVRHLALKCLAQLFTLQPPGFNFGPYLPSIYQIVINPRLDSLSTENTQSASGLLRLFRSWTLTPRYFSYLTEHNPMALKMLLDILVAPKVQPEVVTLVLDVLQTLLDFSPETAVEQRLLSEPEAAKAAELTRATIQKHVSQILAHMRTCFSSSLFAAAASNAGASGSGSGSASAASTRGGNSLALRQIRILSRVSEYATRQTADAKALLDLLLPILRKPNSMVPERSKGDVLEIMRRFVPIVLESADLELAAEQRQRVFSAYLDAVSSCFGRMRLEAARTTLSEILCILARIDKAQRTRGQTPASASTPLENAAAVVQGINSVSRASLGGPDFEQRLEAFAQLNERLWSDAQSLDALAWVPVLHNLTFFAQDLEEMSIRSNASFGLVRFVTRVSVANAEHPDEAETQALNRLMTTILLPAIRYAFTSKHEDIRAEFVGVLRKAVRECGVYFDQLRDLMALDSADEEANFFYNIVHIQLHRRLRALRRFRSIVVEKPISDRAASQAMDVDEANGDLDRPNDGDSDSDNDSDSEQETEANQGGKKSTGSASKADRSALLPLTLDRGNEQISPISQANIRGLFLPLFEHWALAEDTSSVNSQLIQDAIETIGALGAVISWSQYNSALRKYLGMVKKLPEMEKRLSRLVLSILDSFHYDLRHVEVDEAGRLLPRDAAEMQPQNTSAQQGEDDENGDVDGDEDVDMADDGSGEARMQRVRSTGTSTKKRQAERIHETVVTFLLPELKKKISDTNDSNMALRAPLATAVVRILTALPKQTMNAQLPGILTTICNMLRAKAQSARNATRDTLIRIMKFLGPAYFGFVVKELNSSLFRGPQRHILTYTIYTLLKELSRIVSVGQIDYTMEPLIEILIEDVFGQAAQEKEAEEWTTKTKEARVHHGPDCFEILASVCNFENVRMLLAPLRDILRETDTPKRTKTVDQVLHRISVGLNRNRSYSTEKVLKFCHSVINQYMSMSSKTSKDTDKIKAEAELKRLRMRRSKDEEVTVYAKRADVLVKRDYLQANAHRFVEFGLGALYYGLKGNRFDVKSPEVLGMLDPFVDLAGDALFSRFNSIITLGCKIWTILVRLPLPSVSPGIPVVIHRLFSIFRKSATSNSDMIQNCFKLLASILRSSHAEELMASYEKSKKSAEAVDASGKKKQRVKPLLDDDQLRDLIDFIRPDIEEPERQATAFNLIRAVLSRRMLVDSLYTLMDTIRELMITAQADNMRELCRLTWFQFLMDYPLGKRRLDNAMTFIVQNATGYVFESGRMSALEIMGVIVNRFADEILLPNAAEPFFLGLVLIIAKDDSSRCREMAVHLLPELIVRFDQERLKRVWVLLDQWSSGIASSAKPVQSSATSSGKAKEKAVREAQMQRIKMRELGRAALQCYGIIAGPLGERFNNRIPEFFKTIDTALSVSLRTWKEAEAKLNAASGEKVDLEQLAANLHLGADPQQEALAYWETAYMALNTFGRFAKAVPGRSVGDQGQSRIWLLAMSHMTHPHAWVRLAACRLFGTYMANAEPAWMLEAESSGASGKESANDDVQEWDVPAYTGKPKYVLMSVQRLRDLAHAMLIQLSGRGLTPELGNQIVKNLFSISKCFFTALPTGDVAAPEDESESDSDDGSSDADESADAADAVDDNADEDEATDVNKLSTERSLLWLVNRVGRLARTEIIRGRGATEKRNYCFRWFAAVTTLIPPTTLAQPAYIMPIISSLHRTTEDTQVAQTQSLVVSKTPEQQLAELKELASEVLKLVESRLGVTVFTSLLNKVQRHVDTVRQDRRERRKQLAIVDPELHARKKHRKHENTRRRKIEKIQIKSSKSQRTNIIVRRAPKV